MIEAIVFPYLVAGFYTVVLWPVMRGHDDSMNMVKHEGETGLDVIRKGLTAGLLWPVTWGVTVYRIFDRFIIPWLTNQA